MKDVRTKIDRNNRTTQADFSCQKCGYTVHTDYNAVARCNLAGSQNVRVLATAKNIALKHVRAGLKSPRGRATRQLALRE